MALEDHVDGLVIDRPSLGQDRQSQHRMQGAQGHQIHPLYAYVVLLVTTGLRTEELRALRWNEVDLDAGTVAVYRTDTLLMAADHALRRELNRRIRDDLITLGIVSDCPRSRHRRRHPGQRR